MRVTYLNRSELFSAEVEAAAEDEVNFFTFNICRTGVCNSARPSDSSL